MILDVPTASPSAVGRGHWGGYPIEFPDLPGCLSDGQTIEEAITDGLDAMRGRIEAMRAEGIRSPHRPAPRRPEPLSAAVLTHTMEN